MKPTPEQLESIARSYFDGPHDVREAIGCAIDVWESMRPPCADCHPTIHAAEVDEIQRENALLMAANNDVKRIAMERNTAESELNQLKTILADPNAVRVNMLRGTIAWTPETLRSVLGDSDQVEVDKLRTDIAELNQRLHDRTQAFLGKAGRAGR